MLITIATKLKLGVIKLHCTVGQLNIIFEIGISTATVDTGSVCIRDGILGIPSNGLTGIRIPLGQNLIEQILSFDRNLENDIKCCVKNTGIIWTHQTHFLYSFWRWLLYKYTHVIWTIHSQFTKLLHALRNSTSRTACNELYFADEISSS